MTLSNSLNKFPLIILKKQINFLSFKCNIADYNKSIPTPKEGVINVDTRLRRPIYILYEKQHYSLFINKLFSTYILLEYIKELLINLNTYPNILIYGLIPKCILNI